MDSILVDFALWTAAASLAVFTLVQLARAFSEDVR